MHRPAVARLSNRQRAGAGIVPEGAVCHAPAVAVTSNDIARRLQISQSTVSRALRGDPRVAPETRARVLEAAREMNYTPNLAARTLITRKTRHGRGRRQRHHEPVLSRAPRDPPQRVRPRRLSHRALQRADGRKRRAAPRRPRQRIGGGRDRLRVGDARVTAPGTPWRRPDGAREPISRRRGRRHGRLRQSAWRTARRRGDGRARPSADRAHRRAREHDDEPRSGARLP